MRSHHPVQMRPAEPQPRAEPVSDPQMPQRLRLQRIGRFTAPGDQVVEGAGPEGFANRPVLTGTKSLGVKLGTLGG